MIDFRIHFAVFFLATIVLGLAGCNSFQQVDRTTVPYTAGISFDERSPFLKAHFRDGRLLVLSNWRTDPGTQTISGAGIMFDLNRHRIDSAQYEISSDSIALFETNALSTSPGNTALTLMTGVSAAMTLLCIANPKACFGSCPTFYVEDSSGFHLLAEGFSSSIAPALEETDTDALSPGDRKDDVIELVMKNEALETHVVRSVKLKAVPLRADEWAYHFADGTIGVTSGQVSPTGAHAGKEDCLDLVRRHDGLERSGFADSTNLAAEEDIILEFPDLPARTRGLILSCRQSLLSTYLFYQSLAYLGSSAGSTLARLSTDTALVGVIRRWVQVIGTIHVSVMGNDGDWTEVGTICESGPLATDTHLLRLPGWVKGPVSVKLRLTKGAWRIDYAALAAIERMAVPRTYVPAQLLRNGNDDPDALAGLRDSTKPLATLPGDVVTFRFQMPTEREREALFLESRGYYLEWMRQEWEKEENPVMATMLFQSPESVLRFLAPGFKKLEPSMEQSFWGSRYGSH
jgi:hypothetical protein